jgi:O-antigen ligase/tetratricopeptide (TPR) repeat protein
LALMVFLVPAVGVPSELMLQDTLKSAIVAFGVLSAALLFFWQRRQRSEPLLWHGLVWLPMALMAYALGSMAWSHTYLAGVEAIRWFLLALLLWLSLNTINRGTLPRLMHGIHAGVTVASIWVALQFWLGLAWFPQGAFPASTFVNRNFFAEYAVSALPFSVWLLATMRAPRWLAVMAFSLAFNVVALMMTGTRSALVALVLLVPVLAIILLRYREHFAFSQWSTANQWRVAMVLMVSVAVLGTLPSDNPQVASEKIGTTALTRSFLRTSSITDAREYTEGSFSIRSSMWKATARMVMANPWAGVGAGAWEVQIPLYQRADTMLETDYYAHNESLQLLSEYGAVVGGLVLAVLFAYLLHSAGTTWRLKSTHRREAPLRALTLASLLALMLVSNAGFPWHLASTGALFMLGLAILGWSDVRIGKRSSLLASRMTLRPNFARTASAVLVACGGLACYLTQQAALAEYKLVHAIQIANRLKASQPDTDPQWNARKAEMLQSIREGVAANAHYRKLTAELAEPLSAGGDWRHAVWILESVAASRPNVAAFWTALAIGYAELAQHELAHASLQQVQRLKPDAVATHALEINLLEKTGNTERATLLLTDAFDRGAFNYDMVQAGYAIGYQTQNWQLAIRSQQLRLSTWPEHAVDAYFRLGKLYAEPLVNNDAMALEAFRAGFDAVPADQKENYRSQVLLRYRHQLQ